MAELAVGDRVASINADLGTIRFIGLVPPSDGEWIGVEWDDPARGKHGGSKGGVSYFKCKHATGGSFVRKQKLNTGISLCEAIRDRYIAAPDTKALVDVEAMYMLTSKGQHKAVEGVGLDKALFSTGTLPKLKNVGLRNQMISCSGPEGSLAELAPNIQEFDLSKNLLSTWLEICKITAQLPSLTILNLSENCLMYTDACLLCKDAFLFVKTLILNKCSLSWNSMLTCASLWPDIEQLHLNDNGIRCLSVVPPNIFSGLKFLNLSGNPIGSWDNVRVLSCLSNLSSLNLNSCSLRDLHDVREDEFLRLTELGLSENLFESYQFFNEINKFPALEQLSCRKNPVFQKEEYDTVKEILIAKIKRLKKFNNSVIDARERSSSEIDYLKKFGQEWKESGGDQDPDKNDPSSDFLRDHPRYMELVAEHGAPLENDIFRKSSALKGNLIEISIEVPDNDNFKPVTRRLPLSMTVANLKMLIQRLTKMEVRKQRLDYISKANPDHIVSLDREFETLHDVSIDPGDTVRVYEIAQRSQFNRARYIQERKKKRMFNSVV